MLFIQCEGHMSVVRHMCGSHVCLPHVSVACCLLFVTFAGPMFVCPCMGPMFFVVCHMCGSHVCLHHVRVPCCLSHMRSHVFCLMSESH